MKYINYLRDEWNKLVSKYTNNKILIHNTFNEVEICYNSSDRYYHNLSHIKFMLSEAENFRTESDDFNSIRFSAWFHYIIYEVNRSDNEERSADMAKAFLIKINYDKIKILNIKNLIRKTKNHQNTKSTDLFDILIFLDLDLLILGTQRDIYDKYAENVRKEPNCLIPLCFAFCDTKFASAFLKQPFSSKFLTSSSIAYPLSKAQFTPSFKTLSKSE